MTLRPIFGPWPPRSPSFNPHSFLQPPSSFYIYGISPNSIFPSTSTRSHGPFSSETSCHYSFVSKSVIHPFHVANHCSLIRFKYVQRAASSQFATSSSHLTLHSQLASVGPQNIFLGIFISKESMVIATSPRFTDFPLVPLLRDYSGKKTCVFSLFLHKISPLVSDKHTITNVTDFRL